jgi:hypothetical protein
MDKVERVARAIYRRRLEDLGLDRTHDLERAVNESWPLVAGEAQAAIETLEAERAR